VATPSEEAARPGSPSEEAARPRAPSGEAAPQGAPSEPETLEEIEEFEVLDDEPAAAVASAPRLAVAAPVPASVHRDPAARVVMVVEDDASIRAMIVRALGMSYTVFEADDGQTALDILALIPPPACIISDWMMPRVDGVTLAKHVRADKALKWTPLLLLTAKNHPLDVVQGINAGARHYLAKPFKMKELLEKVASVLSKNQLPSR
jgi:CheY-like chemotaxis protein